MKAGWQETGRQAHLRQINKQTDPQDTDMCETDRQTCHRHTPETDMVKSDID